MKTITNWIETLESFKDCPMCGGNNTLPTISPDKKHKYKSEHMEVMNKEIGLGVICNDCGAFAFINGEELGM